MKIDIERLIDAVAAENEAYNEYCYRNHAKRILITFSKNHRLQCEPVQD